MSSLFSDFIGNTADLSWQEQAKCADEKYDPDMWFPPRDKRLYKPIADKAKSVCFGKDGLPPCPVRKECLIYAENSEITHGIWGGMSHRERNALSRKAAKRGLTLEQYVNKDSGQP